MQAVGIYLGVVQFFFVTCWTVYVIYLPQLAAQAGIPAGWVPLILMADQAVFAVTDLFAGVAADRVVRTLGRLGAWMAGLTALSCLAFVALPLVAPAASPALLLAITFIWTLTSAALRAPPATLLGRHVAKPAVPWMAGLMLLGMGLAGALAPYLTVQLRGTDPRLPFVLASVALVVAASALVWAEKRLVRTAPPPQLVQARMSAGVPVFFAAVALLALGFQIHTALNAAPLYLRFASATALEYLMPVFWIGFSLLVLPASYATRRFGGMAVMAAGGVVGGLASGLAPGAGSLTALVLLQAVAGAAWAAVLMSAVASAVALGSSGHEGAATGGLFMLLALAALTRIAMVAMHLPQQADMQPMLAALPPIGWVLAGLVLAVPALRARRSGVPP